MHDTIPQHPAPAEDPRLTMARDTLAELPPIDSITLPYQWLGLLRTALADLVAVASPGGMDNGQREVLAAALADAINYRDPWGECTDCESRDSGLCLDHSADLSLTDAYLQLANELGLELDR